MYVLILMFFYFLGCMCIGACQTMNVDVLFLLVEVGYVSLMTLVCVSSGMHLDMSAL